MWMSHCQTEGIRCEVTSGVRSGLPDVGSLLLNGIGAGLFQEQIHMNLRHTIQGPADR